MMAVPAMDDDANNNVRLRPGVVVLQDDSMATDSVVFVELCCGFYSVPRPAKSQATSTFCIVGR
jgi:hypothetical protein